MSALGYDTWDLSPGLREALEDEAVLWETREGRSYGLWSLHDHLQYHTTGEERVNERS